MIRTRRLSFFLLTALITCSWFAEGQTPHFVMGDYEGGFINPPKKSYQQRNPSLCGRVICKGNETYEVQLFEVFDRRAHFQFKKVLTLKDDSLTYSDPTSKIIVDREGIRGELSIKQYAVPFKMEKVERLSPTLGRKAPEGAIELLPRGNMDQWQHAKGEPASWNVLEDGVVQVSKKSLQTKRDFGDCEVHIEFRLPYEPDKEGQDRGNSGLYLQGKYEIQILDSYGLNGDWRECGALYKVSPPKVNMCAPPLQWQTYDIIFKRATFDKSGNLVSMPIINVKHNGVLIHNEQECFEIPSHIESMRTKSPPSKPGPIILQDHGHKVEFRNVWIKPLEKLEK